MRARELEALLSKHSGRTRADLDARGRILRERGLQPSGGRGPYAPQLTPSEAAVVVLAAGASRRATEVAQVEAFLDLRPVSDPAQAFAGAGTFHDAVASMLGSTDLAATVERIVMVLPIEEGGDLVSTAPWATIQWMDQDGTESVCHFVPAGELQRLRTMKRLDRLGAASMRDTLTIGGGLIAEIALALSDESVAGYREAAS